MISNLDKDSCDVINIYVKDSDKYLYIIVFSKKLVKIKANLKLNL